MAFVPCVASVASFSYGTGYEGEETLADRSRYFENSSFLERVTAVARSQA